MSFVHPEYLWFLTLLAIPILIHLFYFRRHKRFYFPSLKYIKQQEQEKKSVKNLKRWLILAFRLLLIAALIFAFAQPMFKGKGPAKDGIPVTLIYLDNSYSMSAKGVEGSLLSESKEISKRIVNEANSKMRFIICTNALSGIERKLHTKATAFRYLDEVQLNRTPRHLGTVLTFQDEYITRYHREIGKIASVQRILVSDFQTCTSDLAAYKPNMLPMPVENHVLQIIPQKMENRTIDSLWTEEPVHKPGQPIKLFFRVKNCSEMPVENLNVGLDFEGNKRSTNVSLKSNESQVSYFLITPTTTGFLEGTLSLSDPTVIWDDAFYFTNRSAKSGKVLLINGKESGAFPEKAFKTEPYYEIVSRNEESFNAQDLFNNDLVVLNELNSLPSGNADALKAFVAQGGSIFIIPGKDINQDEYNYLLKKLGMTPFSGTMDAGNQVSEIRYRSAFFRGMFEKEKQDLNLPLMKRIYSMGSSNQSNAEPLIILRNKLPLLLHYRTVGNVFLLTGSTEESNGGLVRHALYPSLLLRAAELSIRSLPLYYILGESSMLSMEKSNLSEEPVQLVRNQETFIPRQTQRGNLVSVQLNTPEMLERMNEGIYQVTGADLQAKIGINLNRGESNLNYRNQAGIQETFSRKGMDRINYSSLARGASSYSITLDKPNASWEIFVILALIFAMAEMAVIKFINP